MRKEQAVKNVFSSFFSYVFLLVTGIVLRKILLYNFDTELVGYEGLLSDLFAYIGIVNFGTESILTYRLYKEFANNNKERIIFLVNIYRTLYFTIALITFVLCIGTYFLLPYIFATRIINWNYFIIMFILLSITNICNYLFGYWRTILTASQNEYKAITIETIISFAGIIIKIIILYTTKSFILYLLLTNIITILSYVLIYLSAKKSFPFISYQKITFSDIKNEGIFKEFKSLVYINISNVVLWSTTNIFIMLLFDAKTTALFLNYSLISSACWGVITKIIYPMRASIADLIYKEDSVVSSNFYDLMDLACFFIASVTMCGFVGIYQQTISIIFGNEYLLPYGFVICYAIQNYFLIKSESTTSFRNAFGDYDIEQKYSIPCILSGILCPIIFSKLFGLGGIFIGLTIPLIIKWHCNNIIVLQKHLDSKINIKIKKEIIYFLLSLIETCFVSILTKNIEANIVGIIIATLISVLIPLVLNIILFRKNDSFEGIVNTFLSLIKR